MSRTVTYIATRELIVGRSLNDEVTLTFDGDNLPLRSHERSMRVKRKINTSIGNVGILTFENYYYEYTYQTTPLMNNQQQAKTMREFFASVADQLFTFTPGSDYDDGASPSTAYSCYLKTWREQRVRTTPDRYSFRFVLTQITNAG